MNTDDPEELLKEFGEDCELQGKTDETIRRYLSCLGIYVKFLKENEYHIMNLNKNLLRDFMRYLKKERGVKDRTIEAYFSAMNSFYEFLQYEGLIDNNPIIPFRKRYLNNGKETQIERKIPDIETMSRYINSIPKIRDKAIVLLFAKTGIRRGELISIDLDDIDWENYSIELKDKPKRTNRVVFFDRETARVLERWIEIREQRQPNTPALFINQSRDRLKRHGVSRAVKKWAEKVGLHDPDSDKKKEKFTPHCLRHWFTTIMRREGLERQFIQELRGDKRKETVDIYDHIDKDELKNAYKATIPELGIV